MIIVYMYFVTYDSNVVWAGKSLKLKLNQEDSDQNNTCSKSAVSLNRYLQ